MKLRRAHASHKTYAQVVWKYQRTKRDLDGDEIECGIGKLEALLEAGDHAAMVEARKIFLK